jgi:lipopolysaccharide/colanic/teichoic acid biosynthesis glycosyltransferase
MTGFEGARAENSLQGLHEARTQMGNSFLKTPALWALGTRRVSDQKIVSTTDSSVATRTGILQEETFHSMLTLERRRAERSRKPFVLMLLDASPACDAETSEPLMSHVTSILLKSIRETDLVGWYQNGVILGVIFTEVSLEGTTPVTEILSSKVVTALHNELSRKTTSKLVVTVHLFPESRERGGGEPVADIRLYPDLTHRKSKKRLPQIVKRVFDVAASATMLLLLGPLLTVIALAIQLTSKGSVVFQQERLGQFGSRFKFLKFRTMYANNDPKVHQEYTQRFIAGQSSSHTTEQGKPIVYKITNDSRVTPIGRFLRKTSLDELPQLWNVLRGEMSLVGPRPPVPYEFEVYDIWHRRRVLEVKPGVTGLWQVSGRSRMCFDDMVRLDLRYCQSWSLLLDLKILIATPRAVISGEGAY